MKAVKSKSSGDQPFYWGGLCGGAALTNHQLPAAASAERKARAALARREGTAALILAAGWLPRGLALQGPVRSRATSFGDRYAV